MDNSITFHSALIKQTAKQVGFELVGIAKAEKLTEEFDRYQEWLDSGYHATMHYLERNREKRKDIREILPGAQSVIVLGLSYYTPHQHNTLEQEGKISRYAWGTDYHEILPGKMQEIVNVLQNIDPNSESKIYVDTGPIPEKQWARKAGIGWQGKHSNIISREIGSWFFLGIIITTIQLEYDSPIEDYCGTCTACIDACPTTAIIQPYTVDANKCLSYWTIEAKPHLQIPVDISENMQQWIYGCDICQDVCPWNRFSTETTIQEFHPRDNETSLTFTSIEQMKQEDFSERFRKSPVKRTKLAGLQRNVQAIRGTEE
jgi:epoxyqueuosine reductase